MSTKLVKRLFKLSLILFVVSLFYVTATALMAQDIGTNAVPVIGSPDAAASFLTPILLALTGKYGWVVTVFTVIGVLRFFAKPVIGLIEAYVKSTPNQNDDAFLAKCESSAAYRWFMWALDWLGSIKPPGSSTTNPLITGQGK